MPEKKDRIRTKSDELGVQVKGATTRKLIKNQKAGTADFRDDPDRDGGNTRTSRG